MRYLFNDGWEFLETPLGTAYELAEASGAWFRPLSLPHDWLIGTPEDLYRDGTGWYKKVFHYGGGAGKVFLIFDGVYMDSVYYLNGKQVGEWKNGYARYVLDITNSILDGENQLFVSVTVRHPDSLRYTGAGIYRDVYIEVLGETYIPEGHLYISSSRREDGTWILRTQAEVFGAGAGEAILSHVLTGREGQFPTLELLKGVQVTRIRNGCFCYEKNYLIKDIQEWSLARPTLYDLAITLSTKGRMVQREVVTIGFREVRCDAREGFFLNDKRVELRGVNLPHDLGAFGTAFSRAAMERRLSILKGMGVNALRIRYMPSGYLLTLADELGLLVFSEAFASWGEAQLAHDYAQFFPLWHERDGKSWLQTGRNHPSVVLWGIGSDILDMEKKEGKIVTQELLELVKKYDPYKNALPTLTSSHLDKERVQECADLVPVVGYSREREGESGQVCLSHPDWALYEVDAFCYLQVRGCSYRSPNMPVFMLEEGRGGGSVYGGEPPFGESRPLPLGRFLKGSFDQLGESRPYRTKSTYDGLIDSAGFPKDAYYVLASAWTQARKAPMVYIFPSWEGEEGERRRLWVCSNAPQVELFLNGQSLGRRTLSSGKDNPEGKLAVYDLSYTPGEVLAQGLDYKGRVVASTSRHSYGEVAALLVEPENQEVHARSDELLFLDIFCVDQEGYRVEDAANRVCVEVTGAGRLLALDNGDGIDYDGYQLRSRRLFAGRLLAIVAPADKPGEICVRVSSQGLREVLFRTECLPVMQQRRLPKFERNGIRSPRFLMRPQTQVVTGQEEELVVRRVTLIALEGNHFTAGESLKRFRAMVLPQGATDQSLSFLVVDERGEKSPCFELISEGQEVRVSAKREGRGYLCAISRAGTGRGRVAAFLELLAKDLGEGR